MQDCSISSAIAMEKLQSCTKPSRLYALFRINEVFFCSWFCHIRFRHISLRWRRNGHGCVSNHQPHHCLLNRLFGCRSKKTSKLRVTGLCAGNSPGTGGFPAQMTSNAENVSIWWRHHGDYGNTVATNEHRVDIGKPYAATVMWLVNDARQNLDS